MAQLRARKCAGLVIGAKPGGLKNIHGCLRLADTQIGTRWWCHEHAAEEVRRLQLDKIKAGHATLCAERVAGGAALRFFAEPGGETIPTAEAERLIESGEVVPLGNTLFAGVGEQQWRRLT